MTMVTVPPTLLVPLPNPLTTAMASLGAYLASLMPLKVLNNYGGGTVADIMPKRSSLPLTQM